MLQLGARFYWPEVGRFVQQDPIGDGVNWYIYAEDNPLVWIDPTGLWGGGVAVCETTDVGLGMIGAGQSAAAGVGVLGGGPRGIVGGAFGTAGGFAGGPHAPADLSSPTAVGAYAGVGINVFVTNASDITQLTGAAPIRNFGIGKGVRVFSLQTSEPGGELWVLSYGGLPLPGVAVGGAASTYNANTAGTGISLSGLLSKAKGKLSQAVRRLRDLVRPPCEQER